MDRMNGRVVISGITDPAFVMALDETFHTIARDDRDLPPVLHFYRKLPSISLGYFQSSSEAVDIEACRERGVGIFRRKSGGGTIFEDEDQLIYGLTLPRPGTHGVPSGTLDSFRFLNSPLITTLQELGFPAEYVPVNDILIRRRKVSGCAQTRSGGVLLQHGTLIFRHDPEAMFHVLRVPEEKLVGKGLLDPADRVTSLLLESSHNVIDHTLCQFLGNSSMDAAIDLLQKRLISHFSDILGIRFEVDAINEEEREMADDLASKKYRDDEWTYRR